MGILTVQTSLQHNSLPSKLSGTTAPGDLTGANLPRLGNKPTKHTNTQPYSAESAPPSALPVLQHRVAKRSTRRHADMQQHQHQPWPPKDSCLSLHEQTSGRPAIGHRGQLGMHPSSTDWLLHIPWCHHTQQQHNWAGHGDMAPHKVVGPVCTSQHYTADSSYDPSRPSGTCPC
jgi:hypothetical protein